jgi:long-subunit fatty acid transport protein
MKAMIAAACGLLIAGAATAQVASNGAVGSGAGLSSQSDTADNASSSAQNNDGVHRICRRVETSSASRMSTRRICRTAEEWREADHGN